MKRYHQEQRIINKQIKRRQGMRTSFISGQPLPPTKWDTQRGRYRKKDAHDCGKTDCCLCHYEKVCEIAPIQQKRADVNFKEQLRGD